MRESATRTRREEYTATTRRALLEAAIEAFGLMGFANASTEAIATAARVTKGAFYHHFADKKAIFDAAVVELQARAARRIAEVARPIRDPWDRFDAGLSAYLDICAEPDYASIVVRDAGPVLGDERFREIEADYCVGQLTTALRDLAERRLIKSADVSLLGRLVDALICELSVVLQGSSRSAETRAIGLAAIDRVLGR